MSHLSPSYPSSFTWFNVSFCQVDSLPSFSWRLFVIETWDTLLLGFELVSLFYHIIVTNYCKIESSSHLSLFQYFDFYPDLFAA